MPAVCAIAAMVAAGPVIAQEPRIPGAAEKVLRGRFVQDRVLVGFDAPLRSEGRFAFATGMGLIWRTERPFPSVTAISAGGLIQKSGETEVLRLSASRIPVLSRLFDLIRGALLGDWRPLEEHFKVRKDVSGEEWKVTLTPRPDSAAPFESVDVAGGQFAQRIEIRKKGGDVDRLRFFEQAVSKAPFTPAELALLRGTRR